MENKKNERALILALILSGIACGAAGVVLSMKLEKSWIFTVSSIPTALLLAGGFLKLYNFIKEGGLRLNGPQIEKRTRTSGGIYRMPNVRRTEFDAEVIGVTRNLRLEGEKEVFYIVCKYVDPDTGEESTYTSRELPEYPGKHVIGKMVHVTVDPKDPGKYNVDIDAIL